MIEARHKHKCPEDACGHIWEHEASPDWSAVRFYKEHCCPKCGAWQDTKYYAPGSFLGAIVTVLCRMCARMAGR